MKIKSFVISCYQNLHTTYINVQYKREPLAMKCGKCIKTGNYLCLFIVVFKFFEDAFPVLAAVRKNIGWFIRCPLK